MNKPNHLKKVIAKHITQHGPLSFATWMNTVLNHPKWGYYANKEHIFGAEGDFITASEHCPVYSAFVAQYAAQLDDLVKMDTILEIGPGSGAFAIGFMKAAAYYRLPIKKYYLYEPSAKLREKLHKRLQQDIPEQINKVEILDDINTLKISGMLILNEIFDVLPVHLFQYQEGDILERKVHVADHTFALQAEPFEDAKLKKIFEDLLAPYKETWPQGYQGELCLEAKTLMAKLGEILEQGYVFVHDYGDEGKEYYHPSRTQGSIRCFYQHQVLDNFFENIGQQDITASVNFTQLADFAQKEGFTLINYKKQMDFLAQLEVPNFLLDQALSMHNQLRFLLLPERMGEKFKIMVLKK